MNSIFSFFFRIAIALFLVLSVTLANGASHDYHAQLRKYFEQDNIGKDVVSSTLYDNKENLAHKILQLLQVAYVKYKEAANNLEEPNPQEVTDYLYSLERLYEICGDDIFNQQNEEGNIPFAAYPVKFSKLFAELGVRLTDNLLDLLIKNYLPLKRDDPDFFTIPLSDGTTPLMVLAFTDHSAYRDVASTLTGLGKTINQRDRWGHTAEQWIEKKALGANYPLALYHLKQDLSGEPLDDSFWSKLEKESTHGFINSKDEFSFDKIAFNALLLNQDRTGLKESFLQRNITVLQSEANQLWKDFFKTSDRLKAQHIRSGKGDDKKTMDNVSKLSSHPMRVLEIINRVDHSLSYPEARETTQTIISKILSTGGTFGMNFKRIAIASEAKIMRNSMDVFVRSADFTKWDDTAQEVMNAFFVAYPLSLEKTQQDALDNHQLNCVILGLYSAFVFYQPYSENLFSEQDLFPEIDKLVAAKKGYSVSAIRSKDRYDKIIELIGS